MAVVFEKFLSESGRKISTDRAWKVLTEVQDQDFQVVVEGQAFFFSTLPKVDQETVRSYLASL